MVDLPTKILKSVVSLLCSKKKMKFFFLYLYFGLKRSFIHREGGGAELDMASGLSSPDPYPMSGGDGPNSYFQNSVRQVIYTFLHLFDHHKNFKTNIDCNIWFGFSNFFPIKILMPVCSTGKW